MAGSFGVIYTQQLVIVTQKEEVKGGYFYLFCDFPGQPDLSKLKTIDKAIRMYKMRRKIEEVHRHMKQVYGWEKIQLTAYHTLFNKRGDVRSRLMLDDIVISRILDFKNSVRAISIQIEMLDVVLISLWEISFPKDILLCL